MGLILLCAFAFFSVESLKGHLIKSLKKNGFAQYFFLRPGWLQEEAEGSTCIRVSHEEKPHKSSGTVGQVEWKSGEVVKDTLARCLLQTVCNGRKRLSDDF